VAQLIRQACGFALLDPELAGPEAFAVDRGWVDVVEEPFDPDASQNIQCRAAGVQAREWIARHPGAVGRLGDGCQMSVSGRCCDQCLTEQGSAVVRRPMG